VYLLTIEICLAYNCHDKYFAKEEIPLHPDESIGFLISQTYRKIVQLVTQRLKDFDITPEQYSILCRITQQDGLNQKEIALRAAKDQPTTARILEVLVNKGLVEKRLSAADRRAYLVYSTPEGKALVEQTTPIEQRALADVVKGIDPAQLETFKNLLVLIAGRAENLIKE
jgi:DNA-binding MarR family transcriptional regulator